MSAPNPAPVTGAGDYREIEAALEDCRSAECVAFSANDDDSGNDEIDDRRVRWGKGQPTALLTNTIADLRRRLGDAEHNARLWWDEHQRADTAESALRDARETGRKEMREEAAHTAETQNFSVVTLAENGEAKRKGPFTIQDEATASCAANIAAAIRALPSHPKGA